MVLLQILHIVTLLDPVDLVVVQHTVAEVVGLVILLLLVLLKDFQVVLQLLLIVVEVVAVLPKLEVYQQIQLKELVVMVYFGLQMLYVVLLLEKPVLLVFIFQVVALALIPVEH